MPPGSRFHVFYVHGEVTDANGRVAVAAPAVCDFRRRRSVISLSGQHGALYFGARQ